jgi:hypothetical protein
MHCANFPCDDVSLLAHQLKTSERLHNFSCRMSLLEICHARAAAELVFACEELLRIDDLSTDGIEYLLIFFPSF